MWIKKCGSAGSFSLDKPHIGFSQKGVAVSRHLYASKCPFCISLQWILWAGCGRLLQLCNWIPDRSAAVPGPNAGSTPTVSLSLCAAIFVSSPPVPAVIGSELEWLKPEHKSCILQTQVFTALCAKVKDDKSSPWFFTAALWSCCIQACPQSEGGKVFAFKML